MITQNPGLYRTEISARTMIGITIGIARTTEETVLIKTGTKNLRVTHANNMDIGFKCVLRRKNKS